MNIICNSCLGARLYQLNKMEYQNPFMWNIITSDDIIKLIKNYDKLNFKNFDLLKSDYYNRTEFYRKQFKNELKQPMFIFKIRIDNQIDLHYIHYRFNVNEKNTIVKDVNVESNKIWEYVVEKYNSRLKRMLNNNENPKFVITALESDYTLNKQEEIANIETNYKIIMLCDNPEKIQTNNSNILIKKIIRPIGTCMNLAKNYNDLILNF